MKSSIHVLAALILAATSGVAKANDVDPVKAAKALEDLKADVAGLQTSQQPMHDADAVFKAADKAMNDNQTLINAKKKELQDAESAYKKQKKSLEDQISRAGGVTQAPELAKQLSDLNAAWPKQQGALQGDQTTLERTRSNELKPAYDTAKTDKDKKHKIHDTATGDTNSKAKEYGKYNCPEKPGILHGTHDVNRPKDLTDDCKEVRDQVDDGLCKNEDLGKLLASVGIDAKSKNCGPANGSTPLAGGIGGAGVPQ